MQSLIDQIKDAFSETDFPGEDNLTDSMGDEPDALINDFRDKQDWKALSTEFLNQAPEGWGSALSFFSAKALQFYLPAYLIADIQGKLECGDATSRLCTFVTPQMENKKLAKFYGGGTLGEHSRKDFSVFSTKQVSAIVAYLLWKLDTEAYNPTVEQALENYWLKRDTD